MSQYLGPNCLNHFFPTYVIPLSQSQQNRVVIKKTSPQSISTKMYQTSTPIEIAASSIRNRSKPIPIPAAKKLQNDPNEEKQDVSPSEKNFAHHLSSQEMLSSYLPQGLSLFDEELDQEMTPSSVASSSATTPTNISTSPSVTASKNESLSSKI